MDNNHSEVCRNHEVPFDLYHYLCEERKNQGVALEIKAI